MFNSAIKKSDFIISAIKDFKPHTKKDDFDELFKEQVITGSSLPRNLNTVFLGPKGAGKSHAMSALINKFETMDHKPFMRYIYVYSEHVDSSIFSSVDPQLLLTIHVDVAAEFFSAYVSRKTRFCSCIRYLRSIHDETRYSDFAIHGIISQYHISTPEDLVLKCKEIISKMTDTFIISVDDQEFVIDGGFGILGYDLILLDDMLHFSELQGTTARNSKLAKYLSTSRHYMSNWWLGAQSISQLVKIVRTEIVTIIMFSGSVFTELQLFPRFLQNKKIQPKIYKQFRTLKKYEALLVNLIDWNIESITFDQTEIEFDDDEFVSSDGF